MKTERKYSKPPCLYRAAFSMRIKEWIKYKNVQPLLKNYLIHNTILLSGEIDISYDLVGILPASLLADLQNGETA